MAKGRKTQKHKETKTAPKKTKKNTVPPKKERNFISLDDIELDKIITIKQIKKENYAYVRYKTKKKSNEKDPLYGLIKTSEFVTAKSKPLIEFMESKIEFEKATDDDEEYTEE